MEPGFPTRIDPYVNEILGTIISNHATMLVAPTGSGKSIRIPYEIYRRLPSGSQVFVTVPTIQAVLNLHGVVNRKFKVPDRAIGYAADSNVAYNNTTSLIYCTAGHMRRKLISVMQEESRQSEKSVNPRFTPFNFDFLIVDEIHTGSVDITMILSIWSYYYQIATANGISHPRLIMMSATPSTVNLGTASYAIWPSGPNPFEGINRVQIRYHDNDNALYEKDYFTEIKDVFLKLHKEYPVPTYGDVLIFAPGESDINAIYTVINSLNIDNLILLTAHSTLPQDEMEPIFMTTPFGFRKVIISTNIAESSLTIEGLDIVISVPLERIIKESASGGTSLVTVVTSRSSETQRAGRAGRTNPNGGICYRMCTENTYLGGKFIEHRLPEIRRVPFYPYALEIYSTGLNPVDFNLGIPQGKISESGNVLDAYFLISQNLFGKTLVTEKGYFVQNCTLSVRNSALLHNALLYYKDQPSIHFHILVAVCLMDGWNYGYFYFPPINKKLSADTNAQIQEDHRAKYFDKYEGSSDLVSCLLMFEDFYLSSPQHFDAEKKSVKKWAVKNSIRYRNFVDCLVNIRRVMKTVEQYIEIKINPSLIGINELISKLHPLIIDVYNNMRIVVNFKGKYSHNGSFYINSNRNRLITYSGVTVYGIITRIVIDKGGKQIGIIDFAIEEDLDEISTGMNSSKFELQQESTEPSGFVFGSNFNFTKLLGNDYFTNIDQPVEETSFPSYQIPPSTQTTNDFGYNVPSTIPSQFAPPPTMPAVNMINQQLTFKERQNNALSKASHLLQQKRF